ncbi:MAG TPA: FAD-binding protein [Pseudonocardia sp.]|jgi:glycolate oxidase FAD binding subunit|nr:FAD-binding protein [Pseudonocardia sp.]
MTTHSIRRDAPGTVRPTGLDEAASALADTSGRVLIKGSGTATDWAGRTRPPELVLDTTAMRGVLVHNPGDMTVAVRAGTTLRELNATLAEHGQRLALDAARVGEGATLGGLFATGDSGPSALVYGSLRDLVIGATLVLADGTVAHTGGHVIKNVAGYDLTKLVHGSHGTIALIAELVLRLHPIPSASATVRLECPLTDAPAAVSAVLTSPLEPVAIEWSSDALLVRLDGRPGALDRRAERLIEVLRSAGPTHRLVDADADAEWAEHAARVSRPPDDMAILRVGSRPSRLSPLLTRLCDELGARHPVAGLGTGIGTVAVPATAEAVARAHAAVHAIGGTSVLRTRPDGAELPAWGPAPTSVGVLRALIEEFDPNGRLGAGRFSPWLDEVPQ